MKSLMTTLCTLAAAAVLLLPAPAATACGEENTCNNRPEIADATNARADAPQTRALKKKPKKECHGSSYCERSADAAQPDAPQTRALKKKPKMEECEENTCN